MTFRQFQGLDKAAQELVLCEEAVAVAERSEQGYIYHLYQLSGFYVEVKYDIILDTVASFSAFDSTTRLDPYLQSILIEWPF